MTALRTLIGVLDRPGGRKLLSAVATWHARSICRHDVDVFYDGVWMHRVGGLGAIVDRSRFAYYRDSPAAWKTKLETIIAASEDFWFHRYQPRPGDTIVDVGAAAGEDALVFSRAVGEAGRVIAIEAHPRTFSYLEKVCRWNSLANTTCLLCATMDRSCTVEIEDREKFISNTVLQLAAESGARRLEVRGETLDRLLSEQGVTEIDFLKMNIEGAERLAIDGMQESLANSRHVCIACHDFRADRGEGEAFRTRDYIAQRLEAQGFRLTRREDDPRPYVRDHIYASRS